MAKLVFGLQQSLDGYVDHLGLRPPGPAVSRHFVEHVHELAGIVYGRRTYEIMRYWDEDHPEIGRGELDFAAARRILPKWVVSRSLKSVGPNASLVEGDIRAAISGLKALPPPHRAWSPDAILRRRSPAAPPCGQRSRPR